MKRYGLLKESNNKKHDEKVAKERKNAQIQRLHETIDKLKAEIESLKDENTMLKNNNLGGVINGVKDNADTDWMNVDLKPKAMFG